MLLSPTVGAAITAGYWFLRANATIGTYFKPGAPRHPLGHLWHIVQGKEKGPGNLPGPNCRSKNAMASPISIFPPLSCPS